MTTQIKNNYEKLDRALRKIGISLTDENNELKTGGSIPCMSLVRKIVLSSSSEVAHKISMKNCTVQSSDRKVLLSTFEMMREFLKYSPPISIDQFFAPVID